MSHGPMLEQAVPEEWYTMEGTRAGVVLKGLQPIRRTHDGAVHEGLYPTHGRDPTLEQVKNIRRKEQQRQNVVN